MVLEALHVSIGGLWRRDWEEDNLLASPGEGQIAADIAFLGGSLQKVNPFSFFFQL